MTEQPAEQKKQEYTAADVAAKMEALQITGISSRGIFTPSERMVELEQIEQIFKKRGQA